MASIMIIVISLYQCLRSKFNKSGKSTAISVGQKAAATSVCNFAWRNIDIKKNLIWHTLILGATKGLGKEIALECLNRGDNTIEVGSSVRDETRTNRIFLHCDLTSTESVSLLIKKLSELQPINQFFWFSGQLLKGNFKDHNSNETSKIIDINFRNVIPIIHFIWNQMQETTEPSCMVVVSSSSGKKARFDEAIYASTKFAQVGFIKSLGLENKNDYLKICLVLPGGMKTQLWDKSPNKDYENFMEPSKVAKKIISFISEQKHGYAELEIPRGSL